MEPMQTGGQGLIVETIYSITEPDTKFGIGMLSEHSGINRTMPLLRYYQVVKNTDLH